MPYHHRNYQRLQKDLPKQLMNCISRGHTVRAVCESFQYSKDAGFKVVTHMMPDLPNVDYERDVLQFIVSHFFWVELKWN